MMVINVSKLKATLAASLRRVRAGETLVVTDRRREVARLVPIDTDDLVERPALEPFRPKPVALKNAFSGSVDALIAAERGDR
jgi:prevent-host-death family protein